MVITTSPKKKATKQKAVSVEQSKPAPSEAKVEPSVPSPPTPPPTLTSDGTPSVNAKDEMLAVAMNVASGAMTAQDGFMRLFSTIFGPQAAASQASGSSSSVPTTSSPSIVSAATPPAITASSAPPAITAPPAPPTSSLVRPVVVDAAPPDTPAAAPVIDNTNNPLPQDPAPSPPVTSRAEVFCPMTKWEDGDELTQAFWRFLIIAVPYVSIFYKILASTDKCSLSQICSLPSCWWFPLRC